MNVIDQTQAKNDSPIAKIKQAEKDAAKKIEKAKTDFSQKLRDERKRKDEEVNLFEEKQREKGLEKLKEIKEKAKTVFSEEFKKATQEQDLIIKKAESQKKDAIDKIKSEFLSLINS